MRYAYLLIATSLMALTATEVAATEAPAAPQPGYEVGDVLVYKDRFVTVDCQRWEVTDLDRDGYRVSRCGDFLAYVDNGTGRLFKIVTEAGDKLVRFKPGLPTLSFPLAVGKHWSGEYEGYTNSDGAVWTGDASCTVKAREAVEVAAGTFDAYRIECQDDWTAGPFSGVSNSTTWYAPEVGAVVKSVNAQDSKWNMELQSYSSQ